MKIAAIIVTFNRKDLLAQNLYQVTIQKKKPDCVFIVDNASSDGTIEATKSLPFFDEKLMRFVEMKENCGGAGGFYFGMKEAFDQGFDYFLLMDDDGKMLNENTFQYLLDAHLKAEREHPLVLSNSIVTYDGKHLSFGTGLNDEVDFLNLGDMTIGSVSPFNGTLVSRSVVEKVGFPNKDFFIRSDEVDYVSRCELNNVFMFTANKSVYIHPKSKMKLRRFLFKHIQVWDDTPFQLYYSVRNKTYYLKRDKKHKELRKFILSRLLGLIYQKDKVKKFKTIIRAVRDGKRGLLGKTI